MAAQVYQQHIEVLLEVAQLLVPNGAATTRTMHEGHPWGVLVNFKCVEVQHALQTNTFVFGSCAIGDGLLIQHHALLKTLSSFLDFEDVDACWQLAHIQLRVL